MDTHKLEVLLTAVETGSLNKTAELLGYTQPAVVHMMNSLEKNLDIRLIERTSKGVTLTPEGKLIEPQIRQLVADAKRLRHSITELNHTVGNELNIAALPSIAHTVLPKVMRRFAKDHPDSNINLTLANGDVEDILKNPDIDLVLSDSIYIDDTPHKTFMKDPFVAVVPSGWDVAKRTDITLGELTVYRIIFPPKDKMNPALINLRNAAPRQMTIDSISAGVFINMVEQEAGITVVSKMSCHSLSPAVAVVPIEPTINRNICVCSRDFSKLTALQKDFIHTLNDFANLK